MRSVSSQIRLVSSRSLVGRRLLEELRGAADARQRVLHLVRQHRRERAHRAGGAAMRHLAVDVVGRSSARPARPRPGRRCRRSATARSRTNRLPMRGEASVDAVLGDRAAGRQHLLEQREAAACPSGTNSVQRMADQAARGRRRRTARPPGWRSGCGSPASTTTIGLRERIEQRRRELLARRIGTLERAHRHARPPAGSRAGRKNAASMARTLAGLGLAVDRGAELGRARQALGVPAEMLAGDAHAGLARRNATASPRSARARWRTARPATDRAAARRCAGSGSPGSRNHGRP